MTVRVTRKKNPSEDFVRIFSNQSYLFKYQLIAGGCTLGFCRRRAFRRLRRAAFLRFACGALSRSSFALSSFTLSRLACGGFLSRSVLRALGLVLRSSHVLTSPW